jgi:outer membrane protein assembly factor BamA
MGQVTLIPVIAAAIWITAPFAADAQEPTTRAETLQRQREEKAKALTPPESNRLERTLMDLESGRLFERLLNPAEGLYPKLGNISTGSGFSFGPGYRHAGMFGGHANFSTFAAASFTRYWMIDARLQLPELAGNRVGLEAYGRRYDFPDEDFFGLGPDSLRENEVTYGLANTVFGGSGVYRPTPWLNIGGGIEHQNPRVTAQTGVGEILSIFDPSELPGALAQPEYLRYQASIDVNTRQPRGNPRRGGRYALTYQRYDDNRDGFFSFDRVEVDLQQYIPLVRDRRVLALHALVSTSEADAGAQVPFYLQKTLGGPDDLRGFRNLRFRDLNALLLQAEYRWEIFTAVDGAIFVDAGKVAPRFEDLDLRDLESDVGIGFRFGTINGVFLRIEGAFGSSAGAHFILRFGHVF